MKMDWRRMGFVVVGLQEWVAQKPKPPSSKTGLWRPTSNLINIEYKLLDRESMQRNQKQDYSTWPFEETVVKGNAIKGL